MNIAEQLPTDWHAILSEELQKDYIVSLQKKIQKARIESTVYPPPDQVFTAFDACSFSNCKVLLLGQDPYHGPGQAHGLSFSVPKGVRIPPSLRNMYKERQSDIGLPIPTSGNLSSWAKQGVLLLNAVLTVEEKKAGSHAKWGWMTFTDAIISNLSAQKKPMVFLLWGNFAQKKMRLIDTTKHTVISSVHPSPLSARRGFFGSKPYSKVNAALAKLGRKPIDWQL